MTRRFAFLLCCAALLAACHSDSNSPAAASVVAQMKRPPPAKRGPSPEELTAGMVEAVTLVKSTVPVAVKFDLPSRPVVGQPAAVSIAVMPQIVADTATVEAKSAEQVVIAPGNESVEMAPVDPTQVYRHRIQFVAKTAGVQLLELRVTLKHDDISETRDFSVPVIVAAN